MSAMVRRACEPRTDACSVPDPRPNPTPGARGSRAPSCEAGRTVPTPSNGTAPRNPRGRGSGTVASRQEGADPAQNGPPIPSTGSRDPSLLLRPPRAFGDNSEHQAQKEQQARQGGHGGGSRGLRGSAAPRLGATSRASPASCWRSSEVREGALRGGGEPGDQPVRTSVMGGQQQGDAGVTKTLYSVIRERHRVFLASKPL